MKKLLPLLFLAVPFLFQACADKKEAGGMSERAKKNSESMNGVINAIRTRDLDKLDQYMAADIVDHAATNGPAQSLDAVKQDLREQLKFTSEMNTEVIKELADDEYVMSWLKFKGTMAMDGMGKKKGEIIESAAIELARFNADGKVVEHWMFMEPAEMMKMMGGMGQVPADTSAKPPIDTTAVK